MSQVTILGVSQETLLKNTQSALEGFQNGQPVQKKALIRKALATFLGQKNEHLPSAKFSDGNANIEERLETLLSGFDFLQDWGTGNDEYVERNFECRALDKNAEQDDITIDYRLSFNMESKYSYFIIGKNYGSGINECVEIPLEMIPHLPSWQPKDGLFVPSEFNGKEELFLAFSEMLSIYLAIKNDVLLQDIFLNEEKQKAAILEKRPLRLEIKKEFPDLEMEKLRKNLAFIVEKHSSNILLKPDFYVVSGAISVLHEFGKRYSGTIDLLAFQAMVGRLSDKIHDESTQYVVRTFEHGDDGLTASKVEKSFKTKDMDKFYPDDADIDAAVETGGDLEVFSEDDMKLRYAWDIKSNKPYTDRKKHLLEL